MARSRISVVRPACRLAGYRDLPLTRVARADFVGLRGPRPTSTSPAAIIPSDFIGMAFLLRAKTKHDTPRPRVEAAITADRR